MHLCPECGRLMSDSQNYCNSCGHEFVRNDEAEQEHPVNTGIEGLSGGVTPEQAKSELDLTFRTNLINMAKYMNFFGIYLIITGALSCIGIVTALIGVPIIYAGIRMKEASESYRRLSLTGSFSDLSRAVAKQTRSFYIYFVITIIGLIVYAIYLFVLLIIAVSR